MKPLIPNSYWVEPGRLLAGEHPDAGNEARTRARLQQLVDSGVRHFFDLTQPGELPSYRLLLPAETAYHSFPIPDHSIPDSVQLMQEVLGALRAARERGGIIYLHCRAGIGRTGTVVGCYLRERGASPTGAVDELNLLWQQNARAVHWPLIPETEEQQAFIEGWKSSRPDRGSAGRPAAQRPRHRYRGALTGLALGDALAREQSGGSDADSGTGPLRFTDETGMTLCVAESLLACHGFDGRDQLERYRLWARDPAAAGADPGASLRPSVGNTLARALRSHAAMVGTHDPAVVDPAPLARSAAAALYAGGNLVLASSLGGDVARVTHQAPLAVDTCRLYACMVSAALAGSRKGAVLDVARKLRGLALRDEVLQVAAQWQAPPGGRRPQPAAILGSLDRAVRGFLRTEDFRGGMQRLLDSPGPHPDATLAAFGALAGAYYGEAALPAELCDRLAGRDRMEAIADRLVERNRAGGARVP